MPNNEPQWFSRCHPQGTRIRDGPNHAKSRTHSNGGTDIERVCLCRGERERQMEVSTDGQTDRQID